MHTQNGEREDTELNGTMPPIRHRSRAAAVRSVATERDVIRHRVEARGLRRKIEEARDWGQKRRVRRLVKLSEEL